MGRKGYRRIVTPTTGTLAARPAASAQLLGSWYFDTTSSVLWQCILVGTTPTWHSPSKASVYLSAQGNTVCTGSGGWDAVVGTFAATNLVGFTHAGGVLTHTGIAQVVPVRVVAALYPNVNSTTFSIGVVVNFAAPSTPAAGAQILMQNIASQRRPISLMCNVALATGDTLQVVYSEAGAATPTIITPAGAFFAVG